MNLALYRIIKSFLLFTFLLYSSIVYAQNETEVSITDQYDIYTEAPRELAYVHLNKSTYVKGEMMGFTAYIFDKNTKQPSKMTSNLYCTISDANGDVLKKKLIKVENGVTSNIFQIDSTLSSGIFIFKAYTNWMRNFNEQNHFEQTFKVIDADTNDLVKIIENKDIEVDLQVLGEGGHIVYDIPNTIGIIAKNKYGFGIANAKGSIVDDQGLTISKFQLNENGLAKLFFIPKSNTSYTAKLELSNNIISSIIDDIKLRGIVMSILPIKDKVNITFKTNEQTLTSLKDNVFKMAIHNGDTIKIDTFYLDDKGNAIVSIPKSFLFAGINIFTIFDNENRPILERLFFNTETINVKEIKNVIYKRNNDSLNFKLNIDQINGINTSNLSISVLPSNTKSYNQNNNLLSQLYIQPYIKGKLQNGAQYFKSPTRKTLYDLDLLMLTQGWSSYNWHSIFTNSEKKFIYPFERGINVVANVNNKQHGTYLLFPLSGDKTKFFDIKKGEKQFIVKTIFPDEKDDLKFAFMDNEKKEVKSKPSLFLQFYPSKIPNIKTTTNIIREANIQNIFPVNNNQQINAWDNSKINQLDEVIVKGETKKTKLEALAEKTVKSRIDVIDDRVKNLSLRLDLYLQRLGWDARYDLQAGKFTIKNRRGGGEPFVYLDDALLNFNPIVGGDFSILLTLSTNNVDYIEYDFFDYTQGMKGNSGFIKIYTSIDSGTAAKKNKYNTYTIPLSFSSERNFYTPKYQYYNTDFFKEYGTIAWLPKVKFDTNGNASFKIFNTNTDDITLFVEGIINDNEYISQKINIEK